MASIDFEGKTVELSAGDTIASALFRAGVRTFSRSFKNHRRRSLYCLSGDCPNCLLTVDGEPAVPACVTPAEAGMRIRRGAGFPSAERDALSAIGTLHWLFPVGFYYKAMLRPRRLWPLAERVVRRLTGLGEAPLERAPVARGLRHVHVDLLVVGGGPAGLAAALAGAEKGLRVALCDEGQLGAALAPGPARTRVDELASRVRTTERVTLFEDAAAIGVYEGPFVPVNGKDFLHLVHADHVVVATGALERHAVFPGNDLIGVWLGRGAARMAGVHGVRPGRHAVIATASAEGLEHLETLRASGVEVVSALVPRHLGGLLPAGVRPIFDGEVVEARGRRTITEVVVATSDEKRSIPCDLLVLSLGLEPRDGLLRQGAGLPVTGAGDAVLPGCSVEQAVESGRAAALGGGASARDPALHPVPGDGYVCLCEDVITRDLTQAWTEGFRSTEILKRYTTTTMGPCQGALCQGPLRAFVHSRAGEGSVSARPTARPPARPITLEQAAAGLREQLEARTALHARHLELGARMEWAGVWKRPETYGEVEAEYWAVRRGVSVMDVGTLGKFLIAGADVRAFLERLYPCHVGDLTEGRMRYTLLLNEAGYVIDDGLICALGDDRYYLTFTSGGAERAESWIRDWAETWGMTVHLVNRTAAIGAINVAGPQARELLRRLSSDPLEGDVFPYLHHRELDVAGVPCRAIRLGFVGELSYELHHSSSQSVHLWDALAEAGKNLGIRPHGLEALRLLRLEKAHVLIGQDTDFDTTPPKLGLEWAARMDKDYFLGKTALQRMVKSPPERRLAGFIFEGSNAPAEGTPLQMDGQYVGYLTSCRSSPVLGYGIGLGWLIRTNGEFPASVTAGNSLGRVVEGPFYDPAGERLRA